MKNGSLPRRLLYHLKKMPPEQPFIKPAMLSEFSDSRQIGRALRRLVAEGHLDVVGHGIYRILPSKGQPELSFSRTWSAPSGVDDTTLIAATLAKPTFSDVARLCIAYGTLRVNKILHQLELKPDFQSIVQTMIDNTKAGIANVYRSSPKRIA